MDVPLLVTLPTVLGVHYTVLGATLCLVVLRYALTLQNGSIPKVLQRYHAYRRTIRSRFILWNPLAFSIPHCLWGEEFAESY
jgi:hypothetical protein